MERLWLLSLVAAALLLLTNGAVLVAMLSVLGEIELKTTSAARVLVTNEGPELHTQFPELSGKDLQGNAGPVRAEKGRDLVVILLSSGCAPCEQLLRTLGSVHRDSTRPLDFTAILEASPEDARRYQRRFRLRLPLIVDEEGSLREQLGVKRTPYGFLIDRDGIIRMKGVVNDRGQLEGLISRRGRDFTGLNWDVVETLETASSRA